MSTPDPSTTRRSWQRWATPLVTLTIAVAYFVAGWLGGDRTFAVFGAGLMVATGLAFLLLGRYSETVAGLLDRRDERINRIDTEATAFAGLSVIIAIIAGFVVEVARGHDGSPYTLLGTIAAVAYLAALAFLRWSR